MGGGGGDFQPLILEYADDQFNNRCEWKYFLGKLRFHKGLNKNGQPIIENTGIINFNESANKPISSIHTHWGQSLLDLHHKMFHHKFNGFSNCFFDLSNWFHSYGLTAKEYYKSFLTLFLRDAILFENLFVNSKESSFTESVILPAFCDIERETGFKPLIVPLLPTETESDASWYSYPHTFKAFVDGEMRLPQVAKAKITVLPRGRLGLLPKPPP